MVDRTTQYRLPNVKWGEFSTKKPRTRKTPQTGTETVGMTPQAGIEGLPAQPNIGGPHFGVRGTGKYFNRRNVNGQQFNKTGVKQATENIANSFARSQYFRRAGFGAALRYTLGMQQVPSHVQDWMNTRQRRQTGLNPGNINAMLHHEPDVW